MSQNKKNLEDVNFITEQIIFFLGLADKPGELRRHFEANRMDAFCSLRHPQRGMLICGSEANNRFYAIARRWLSSRKDKESRTRLEDFVDAIKKFYVQRFLVEEAAIDDRNIQKMLSSAYKSIDRERVSLTHFIPCALFSDTEPKAFQVGPVEFLCKSEFLARYHDQLEACRVRIKEQNQQMVKEHVAKGFPKERAMTEQQSEDLGNRLVDSAQGFFYSHSWVAVVSIDASDEKVSRQKALYAVNGALNVLKLLIGRSHTDRIRVAYAPGTARKSAAITQSTGGNLEISSASAWDGNSLGEGWHQILANHGRYHFEHAATALTLSMSFDHIPYLVVRFMDALRWYGDAVSEADPAYQIVKYISALERLTGTGLERNNDGTERGVTEIVTSRSAVLYGDADGVSYSESQQIIKKLYGVRSDLLHGSMSPFDNSISLHTANAEKVVRSVLLIGLDFYVQVGLGNYDITETKLKQAFLTLERKLSS